MCKKQKCVLQFCGDDFREAVFDLTPKFWTIIGPDYILNGFLGNFGPESAFDSVFR